MILLHVIWYDGSTNEYLQENENDAYSTMEFYKMAFGNQVSYMWIEKR